MTSGYNKQEFEKWISRMLGELEDGIVLSQDQRKAANCGCEKRYYDGVIHGQEHCMATLKVNLNIIKKEKL